ncbi:MAG: class I SAM-dependent rRNA methyltransferase [Desulfuromonas sp.]|uniref:class I SAM-dependent rRNA methyltransferase n=1 Tax=Desulfuromonas sp. TaxID=892 RepID=UPI000CBE78F4|nr:class I SAM-dependent rRNA methyltransferase [Desulfuromonas sp.]PLX83660.1 MAG: class I SAM-dependent rRNA methyltransferase [Desulfuromonas sp.]
MDKRRFIVGPETVRMLELGHPWVVADRYTKKWPAAQAGEVVDLCDEKGRGLAAALLDPAERIAARVLGPPGTRPGRTWMEKSLERAVALRRDYLDLSDTTAYRLVNGEGDGLPGLTVDRYGEHLMVQSFSAAWRPHLPLLVQALQRLEDPAGIYEKLRPQQTRKLAAKGGSKRYSRLLAGSAAPGRLPVLENGLTFMVELEEGLNTGLFLDQRTNRRDLAARLSGKSFLNLFAYTGAFSVAAAAAGASRVTSVDASTGYLDWARDNFAANRLNPKRHEFIAGDCFKALEAMAKEGRRFDAILMDPPSFSTTKKSRFTTRGGTSDLVAAALALLPPGGLLVTCSNHQKVDWADYLKELRRGALQAGCELRVIGTAGQPEDFPYPVSFPEGRYLKYVVGVRG